jgi:hypothetical protein
MYHQSAFAFASVSPLENYYDSLQWCWAVLKGHGTPTEKMRTTDQAQEIEILASEGRAT